MKNETKRTINQIDFLPQWYMDARRKKASLRFQYMILGGFFVLMFGWHFLSARAISKATAQIEQLSGQHEKAQVTLSDIAGVEERIKQVSKKVDVINEIDSKINVDNVLAELSNLIEKRIVIGTLEFGAENTSDNQQERQFSQAVLRRAEGQRQSAKHLGDVRFKVTIVGIAVESSDVADLVCNLEDSPYFINVIPIYSRNVELKIANKLSNKGRFVSEFKIVCYLGNFKEILNEEVK